MAELGGGDARDRVRLAAPVDPAAVFQEAELSEEDIAALTSREALQIEHAMMRGAKP